MDNTLYRHPVYTDYAAKKDGTVWSFKRDVPRRLSLGVVRSSGYLAFSAYKDKKRNGVYVHCFVYECLSGKLVDSGNVVDHIDHNKQNNNIRNLREVSFAENARATYALGKNSAAKLSVWDVRFIRNWLDLGYSIKSIAAAFDISRKAIEQINRGETWAWLGQYGPKPTEKEITLEHRAQGQGLLF